MEWVELWTGLKWFFCFAWWTIWCLPGWNFWQVLTAYLCEITAHQKGLFIEFSFHFLKKRTIENRTRTMEYITKLSLLSSSLTYPNDRKLRSPLEFREKRRKPSNFTHSSIPIKSWNIYSSFIYWKQSFIWFPLKMVSFPFPSLLSIIAITILKNSRFFFRAAALTTLNFLTNFSENLLCWSSESIYFLFWDAQL